MWIKAWKNVPLSLQVIRRPRISCGQRSRRSTFLTCVFVLVLVALTAFLMIYIYRNTLSTFVKTFKEAVNLKSSDAAERRHYAGCDDIVVENVWSTTLPFLMSESASRLIHVNDDDVLDVVLGFGTGRYLRNACSFTNLKNLNLHVHSLYFYRFIYCNTSESSRKL